MIPMYNYSMGLIYRTDLLGDAKLQAAYKAATGKDLALPETLERLCRARQVHEGQCRRRRRGHAGPARRSQQHGVLELSLLGRRPYQDKDGKVVLDSPEGLKALELYVDNIKHGAQQGALSATLDDTLRLMCDGKAFSMVTYWWMLPQLDDKEKCPAVAGKVALAVMPGGHGESGGWGWAIPKNETPELQDAAWKFISWVQSEKISIARAAAGPCAGTQRRIRGRRGAGEVPATTRMRQAVVEQRRSLPDLRLFGTVRGRAGHASFRWRPRGEAKPAEALKAAADGLTISRS